MVVESLTALEESLILFRHLIKRGPVWSQTADVNLDNAKHSCFCGQQEVKRQNKRVAALPAQTTEL